WQWLRLLSAFVMGLRTKAITANARPSRVGVSGRYPVIPPIKLSVLRTTENRCPCADFLPPANESHFPKNRIDDVPSISIDISDTHKLTSSDTRHPVLYRIISIILSLNDNTSGLLHT